MEGKPSWKAEMVMEKLRSKANSIRSLSDISKNLRMALMDKRQTMDGMDKAQLQKCLELLQDKVKFHSLQGMVDRLEAVAKQLGIKFSMNSSGQSCFIECDMFYVELEFVVASGQIKEVKIQHEADPGPQPCPELVQCLSDGDFSEFTGHLEGLLAVYKLNADRKLKSRAYPALRGLETDISRLAAIQATNIAEPRTLVHRGPVGIVQLRRVGRPMRLTYLVPPYHLLDVATRRMLPLTVQTVTSRDLGLWAEVTLLSSTAHKLQTSSLISVDQRPDGNSVHSFAPLTSNNSCTLPATFVLKLSEPMPMSILTLEEIHHVTRIRAVDVTCATHNLLSLITRHASKNKLDGRLDQPLYVTLPDQLHCYYLEPGADLAGSMVETVPFTHPNHVPKLLALLRKQALFNCLVASCVRTKTPTVTEGSVCFEVTALGGGCLSVSFEHPQEDTLATLEVELTDGGQTPLVCRLHTANRTETDDFATRVLQTSWSIPVTMRALIGKLRGGASGWSEPLAGPAVPSGGGAVKLEPPGGDGPACTGGGGGGGGESDGPQQQQQQQQSGLGRYQQCSAGGEREQPSVPQVKLEPDLTEVLGSPLPEPSPAATPSSEMDSIEATVRQMELDRARRPSPPPASNLDLFSAANIPASLTITPIPQSRPDERRRERDRRDRDRSSGDKKRRREESPASRSSSKSSESRSSPSVSRDRDRDRDRDRSRDKLLTSKSGSPPAKKHSSSSGSSPNKSHNSSSGTKSASPVPNKLKSSSSSSSQHHSSKHSLHTSSPKHNLSPKHPSVSPKHSSSPKSTSSGKPSLSSLKSPSPSHHSSSSKSGSGGSSTSRSRDKSRDRGKSHRPRSERSESDGAGGGSCRQPGGGGSPSVSAGGDRPSSDSSRSPGRSRKGSLSDVISKLNTLASAEEDALNKDARKAEFTVKPSSEGIKLTINKTKSRSSSSSPSGNSGGGRPCLKETGRSSPSGLKPGVVSGPASKKSFPFSKQLSGSDSKGNSPLDGILKSSSPKLSKSSDSSGNSKQRPEKSKLDRSTSDLLLSGDLPPLPKSLEIKKIERASGTVSDGERSEVPGGPHRPGLSSAKPSRSGSPANTSDLVIDLGGSPRPPPAALPPPPPPPRPTVSRSPFPPSPSVQIHIVQSPAPVSSPHQLAMVSPHSSVGQPSPCVIDDELMDEALVGIGK